MLFLFVTLRACVSLCAEGWTCLLRSGPQCSMPRLADCLLGRWALLGVVVVWGLPGFTLKAFPFRTFLKVEISQV